MFRAYLERRSFWIVLICFVPVICTVCAVMGSAQETVGGKAYLKLKTPRRVMSQAQPWEGDQYPHTLSVIEFKRDGFRYWGWYGLNEGRGIGLARSNDLVHWTKYPQNPLLTNARWPSVLEHANPQRPDVLYIALTRNYDSPSSYIVLATTKDGIHITEDKTLVAPAPNQRNQNPNLFRDPRSGRFYLTFYRGNDVDYFDIVSKSADQVEDLDKAPEKVLLHDSATVAAPTLLYVTNAKHAQNMPAGIYYLATEIFPHRYATDAQDKEWQVKAFAADSPDGEFQPVAGNPIETGQRACLFQHIFKNRFYGYQCRLEPPNRWTLEVVEAPLPAH